MLVRELLAISLFLAGAGGAWGQTQADGGSGATWRRMGERATTPERAATQIAQAALEQSAALAKATPAVASEPADAKGRQPITLVTSGSGELPNDQGQVWREYDISPYTLRATATARPEQAIVDWILRETGYEAWHGEPLGILSASSRKLRVYHTPKMQEVVAGIVDRFVSSQAESRAFGIRVVTMDNPNWRAAAQQLLRPVSVQTPGTQAWILEKENAAILLTQLQRRTDFREHSSPHLLVNNGQSTVVASMRTLSYTQAVTPTGQTWPGYQPEMGQIDEGFSVEFSPLLAIDAQMIDATVKCSVNQVEKMVPVMVDVPTPSAPRQRAKIDVPQVTEFRFHERFRWPTEQVLLIDMGMVALPIPSDGKSLVPGIPLPLPTGPARADLLVFVESRGSLAASAGAQTPQEARREAPTYHGRY